MSICLRRGCGRTSRREQAANVPLRENCPFAYAGGSGKRAAPGKLPLRLRREQEWNIIFAAPPYLRR
ncbi:MAG: hypothetical protein IJW33_03925 [Lentisphaeria bacterium]|nr:hypothetical protein [Lentisphaeria bacterium]